MLICELRNLSKNINGNTWTLNTGFDNPTLIIVGCPQENFQLNYRKKWWTSQICVLIIVLGFKFQAIFLIFRQIFRFFSWTPYLIGYPTVFIGMQRRTGGWRTWSWVTSPNPGVSDCRPLSRGSTRKAKKCRMKQIIFSRITGRKLRYQSNGKM